MVQTFGAFEEYYVRTLLSSSSPSAISWIGSVQSTLVVVLGVVTGPLFDAGHVRELLVLGAALTVLGIATLSAATAYWQVFLAQGLCAGLGGGLVYVPSLALVSTRFPDAAARPWAIGCVNAGGSVGGVAYTFMLRGLIPAVGFGWAVRAVALVALVLAAAALAIILPQHQQQQQHRAAAAAAATNGGTAAGVGGDPAPEASVVAPPRRVLFDVAALREPCFVLFALALLLNYAAFFIPPFYVPTYATAALGQTREFAFEALVYVSVGSFIGRTVPMLAAAYVGAMVVYLAGTTLAAVVLFSWMAVHNVGGLITICLLYGIASGVLVAAPSAVMSHPVLSPTISVIGTRMGISWMFAGVGVLIGAPIAGALVNVEPGHVNFKPAQGFAGAVVAAAIVCLITPLIGIIRYDKEKNRRAI